MHEQFLVSFGFEVKMSLINKEALILPLLFAIIAPSQSLDNSFSIRSLVRISGQHVKGVSSIAIVMLFPPSFLRMLDRGGRPASA